MKTIKLKSLNISNYRGCENLDINFGDETRIYGRNKSGKSTIYNAFLWLMFGRDDKDRANHELFDNTKPATHENATLCSVKGVVEIDGYEYILERTAKQKWARNRVSGEYERTGSDDYSYSVDGVPKSANEYKEFIRSLIDDKVFKCITNTRYFTSLHWKEQREILMQIIGDINPDDLQGDYSELFSELKTMSKDELLAKLDGKRKPIKARLKEIPAIIDDYTQRMPEPVDESAIQSQIAAHEQQIKDYDSELNGSSQTIEGFISQRNSELQVIADKEIELNKAKKEYESIHEGDLYNLKCNIDNIDFENKNIAYKNAEAKRKYDNNVNLINNRKSLIANNEKLRQEKRDAYDVLNAKIFDADKVCPTCKQAMPIDEIEKLQAEFNARKASDLQAIMNSGIALKNEWEIFSKQLLELEAEVEKGCEILPLLSKDELEKEFAEKQSTIIPFEKTEQYGILAAEIEKLRECVTVVPKHDNSSLIEAKKQLYADIDKLKDELQVNKRIFDTERHIETLKAEQVALGIELTKIDGLEFSLKQYERERASLMQEKVNSLFRYCKVMVVETAKDGSDRDTCEITDLNGVKISVVNNADEQLIGLDIIRVLSNHYEVKAPIFCDNAESVNVIPPQETQIIKLFVSNDEKLRIE